LKHINKSPEILIIDDTPEHIHFVASIIRRRNYRVRAVTGALQAFAALEKGIPDLILLDVLMPGMNGFELCMLIKADRLYSSIPIIFLTAVNDSENIVRGFEAGAQDYVSKPVNARELLARIETHLNLKKRTDRLLEAYRDIDSFNHVISHDLKTPVCSIYKLAGFLREAVESGDTKEICEITDILMEKAAGTVELVDKYTSLVRLSSTAVNTCEVNMDCLALKVMEEIKKTHPGQRIIFKKTPLPVVHGDSLLLEQVLVNIFSNAAKYSRKRAETVIHMSCSRNDCEYAFSVKDNGVGFDMKYAENIFNLFVRLHEQNEYEGTGIGLSTVKKIICLHGGKVWITAEADKGAEVCFTLPVEIEVEA